MRILIVTAGSRGDVAPFTGLGQRLRQAGHEVAVAAHDRFVDLIEGCALEHRSLPGDPLEMVRARTNASSPEAVRSLFVSFLNELGEGVLAAAADTEVLLTAFGPAPLSRLVATALDIPSLGIYLLPGVPTRAFAPPGWPGTGAPTPEGNLAAGRAALTQVDGLYAEPLASLRARLGVPASASGGPADAGPPRGWPICHGFSPSVLPRPADWPDHVSVTGYWWPARPDHWQPPDEVIEFLRAGPAPVFFGFGSMDPDQAARLNDIVAASTEQAGVRAVVQSGWAGLNPRGDDILMVDDLPHDWLFPQMAAVVHHAGAGTTGAGIRAGRPTVAAPILVDQPFWAARLHRLGVAPPPLPLPELSVDNLAAAIRACLDEPAYRDRATQLAADLAAEDGAGAVLEHIAALQR
ncbi:MAG TPA: glycosyltransferase [Pseudonocardia sp.]|nr:glycosyltransferase [Pseudonocardia sp.]